jgi:AcrR family transcriptional regulator
MNGSLSNNGSDTKERILDAAERLFAERGISGTSLRAVTRVAAVNLAAVHYHFGSKEALCQAVLARRIHPLNVERIERLREIEARANGRPSVEAIVEAFIAPVLLLKRDLGERGAVWSTLMGRLYSEPVELVAPLLRAQFEELGRRFLAALCRALPELPPNEVFQRFQLSVGVLAHTLSNLQRIEVLPEYGGAEPDDQLLARLCRFVNAGLQAPSVPVRAGSKRPPSRKRARR